MRRDDGFARVRIDTDDPAGQNALLEDMPRRAVRPARGADIEPGDRRVP